jgi:hypothetical protein
MMRMVHSKIRSGKPGRKEKGHDSKFWFRKENTTRYRIAREVVVPFFLFYKNIVSPAGDFFRSNA